MWLNHTIGRAESKVFFKGNDAEAARKKIQKAGTRPMPQGDLEELYRVLEINDLASFWGRVRSKLLYSAMAATIPFVMTLDVTNSIKDYASATWKHLEAFGESYLQINEAENPTIKLYSREETEKYIAFQEKLLKTASLSNIQLLINDSLELAAVNAGRELTLQEVSKIKFELAKQMTAADQNQDLSQDLISFDLGDPKVDSFYTEFVRTRQLLLKMQKELSKSDYELFVNKILLERIGSRYVYEINQPIKNK